MTSIPLPTAFSTGAEALADSFALSEDGLALSLGHGLSLDVLANDLQGAALWSIGAGDSFTALRNDDTAGNWERSGSGNQIRIVNGRVEVDLSASLARYDAPRIASATTVGQVTEDSDTTRAEGLVTATDADTGAVLTYSVQPVPLSAPRYGDFKVDPATGAWSFEIDNASAAIQALGAGQTKVVTYTVVASDEKGALVRQPVTVTIFDTNDGPVLGNSVKTGTATEDVRVAATGRIVATDVDFRDVLTFSHAPKLPEYAAYGTFTVDRTGRWSFTPNNASKAVQALAADETKILEYDVTVKDRAGASVVETVTVTLHGVNDVATFTNTNPRAVVVEDGVTQASGLLTVTDKDAGQAVFAAPSGDSLAGTYGSFTFNAASGAWTYTLANDSQIVQSLGATSVVTDTLHLTSADGSPYVLTVTIRGAADAANPPPTPTVTLAPLGDQPDIYDSVDNSYVSGGSATALSDRLSIAPDGGSIDGLGGDDSLAGSSTADTILGNIGHDQVLGLAGNDSLDGGDGDDVLYGGSGDDKLNGGAGSDMLIGGQGADTLTGGAGMDVFAFYSPNDRGDRITDFSQADQDKIYLGQIDADTTVISKQTLVWGGTAPTAHGVWYGVGSDGVTTVYVDADGDTSTAELWVKTNTVAFTQNDFIL